MRRTVFWTAVLACLLALAGGGWYAWSGYQAAARPQDAVTGYFAALESGDAPGALSYGPVPSGAARGWLTGSVLAQQQRIAALHDVSVEHVTRSGNSAAVDVSYGLRFATGDRRENATLRVHRAHDRWQLEATAVRTSLVVTRAQDRVSLAGADVPASPVLLFPGAVPVQVDTPYLDTAPAVVGFTEPSRTLVVARPTAAAERTITTNVTRQLTACLAGARTARDCPLPSPRTVPGSLQGQVTTVRRTVTVTLDSSAGGILDVTGSITVRGTYRTLTFDNTEQVRTGRLTLPFHATASPFAPLRLYFGVDS